MRPADSPARLAHCRQMTSPTSRPSFSPRQQYDAAIDLLSRARCVEAQSAFRPSSASQPKEELSGSAQFWVGEIAFTQKDYKARGRGLCRRDQALSRRR
jgi:TolA-binding protein